MLADSLSCPHACKVMVGGAWVRTGPRNWPASTWHVICLVAADRAEFAEACGIVPERPLDSKASYRAEFTWKKRGQTRTKTVRFRTR